MTRETNNRILLTYCCLVLFWFLISVTFDDHARKLLDESFSWGDGFHQSFIASLLEDIVFFGIIGLFVIKVTNKPIEEEKFSTRIRAVPNSANVSNRAREVFEEQVRQSLIYAPESSVEISIEEIQVNEGVVKVSYDFCTTLVNMCDDIAVETADTEASAISHKKVDEEWGQINYLKLDENEFIEPGSTPMKTNSWCKKLNTEINRNEKIQYRFKFWVWEKLGGDIKKPETWFYFGFNRFTESCNLTLKVSHACNENFTLWYDYPFCMPNKYDPKIKKASAKPRSLKNNGKTVKLRYLQDSDLVRIYVDA